jgi:hypothetical protein
MPCKPGLLSPPLAALLIAVSAPLAAQEASLQDCQRWQDKIDELTYLRKKARQRAASGRMEAPA